MAALTALAAIIYGASPVDVIPELVFGPLGLTDDALVLLTAGFVVIRLLRKRAVSRGGRRTAPGDDRRHASGDDEIVVERID